MRIQTIEDLLIDNIEESQSSSISMDAIIREKVFQFTQIVRLLRMKMFKSQLDCVDIFWIVWIGILKQIISLEIILLAKFFESGGKFNNYWFSTGTPTFLLDLIMKSKFELSLSLNKPVSGAFFDAFEVTDLDPMVMLFQTGYLTIDRAERRQIPFTSKAITEYYLHFPNMEVEESFNGSLLTYCTNVRKHDTQELMLNLVTAVGTGNVDGFMKLFQSIFAGIPYSIHVKDEHYYQTVFYVICDLLKLLVQAEVCTNDGRIDMMVAAGEWIYVIEFKLNKTADDAMQQIENKDYALKYRKEGHRIMLVGVNFDFNAGNISNWLKEEYCS